MGNVGEALSSAGSAIANGVMQAATHSARAASAANGTSFAAQSAQGQFNQNSANIANTLGSERLAQQWMYNSAGAQMANDWSEMMWDKSAAFNERMLEKQMEFNAEQARINREWQEHMRDTAYQAARSDMEAAGLNPILAVTGGGIQTGSGSGGMASVGLPQMSSASGAMPSAGVMNGVSASEGNFTGQMEYMGGILGLISAGMDGLATALKVMGQDRSVGEIMGGILEEFMNPSNKNSIAGNFQHWLNRNDWKYNDDDKTFVPEYRNGVKWQYYKNHYDSIS